MFRSTLLLTLMFLAAACGTRSELLNTPPMFDEVVEKPQYEMYYCMRDEFERVAVALGQPVKYRNPVGPTVNPAGMVLYHPSAWEAIVIPNGTKKSRVVVRAHTILGDYPVSAFGLIEAIRSCTDVYGSGYDRPLRSEAPEIVANLPVRSRAMAACVKTGIFFEVKPPALLHASGTTVWVSAYNSRPPRNIWEARFTPAGKDTTHMEVRFASDDSQEGGLNRLLRDQIAVCTKRLS